MFLINSLFYDTSYCAIEKKFKEFSPSIDTVFVYLFMDGIFKAVALGHINLKFNYKWMRHSGGVQFGCSPLWVVFAPSDLKKVRVGFVRKDIEPTRPYRGDGYAVALAEIDPEFEGKQVLLAYRRNGQPIEGNTLRLVVPADRHGGRSVRDVVRIDLH